MQKGIQTCMLKDCRKDLLENYCRLNFQCSQNGYPHFLQHASGQLVNLVLVTNGKQLLTAYRSRLEYCSLSSVHSFILFQ